MTFAAFTAEAPPGNACPKDIRDRFEKEAWMTLAFRAPAKINLTLEVLARRDDGYHGVRSVMVPLELADELICDPSDGFSFACDRAELAGDDNLVVRAFRAVGDLPPLRVSLRKVIPHQAGLGGGSSDAAAVLRAAMTHAWPVRPELDWLTIARGLGSDVPFFLSGTGALVEGTGERVTPAGALPPWHVLLVKPPVAVSTAAAYKMLDASARPQRTRATSVSMAALTALQRGRFADVVALLFNDFHHVIAGSTPEIRIALDALRRSGASNALLAGSGSCVFSLAQTAGEIASIAAALALPQDYTVIATAFGPTPDWAR